MPNNQRRQNAAEALRSAGLDALILTHLPNVRYLTGFTGSNAAVVLESDGGATLYTDPRYTIQAGGQADCRVRIAKGKLAAAAMERVRRRGMRRVGFESDHLTVGSLEALKKDLPVKASLEPTTGAIETPRMMKDEGEIAAIRHSVVLNSRALENALNLLRPGMTESELAAEIDYQSRRLGAEAPAFGTIVAAGERAALPHAEPGGAKIGPGMILIDMGAFLHGYASDMSRMVYLGKAPRRYRTVYRAVLEAQQAAVAAIKDGVKTTVVDRAARDVLKAHGLEREFVHSTGHGLGLEIHEAPRIGRKDKTRLAAGMAVTVEPGVYIEGWGGIRIEDTVVVTANGCEILTPTTKELVEL